MGSNYTKERNDYAIYENMNGEFSIAENQVWVTGVFLSAHAAVYWATQPPEKLREAWEKCGCTVLGMPND